MSDIEICGARNPDYPGEYSCTFPKDHALIQLVDEYEDDGDFYRHAAPASGAWWNTEEFNYRIGDTVVYDSSVYQISEKEIVNRAQGRVAVYRLLPLDKDGNVHTVLVEEDAITPYDNGWTPSVEDVEMVYTVDPSRPSLSGTSHGADVLKKEYRRMINAIREEARAEEHQRVQTVLEGHMGLLDALYQRISDACLYHESHRNVPAEVQSEQGWINVDDYALDLKDALDSLRNLLSPQNSEEDGKL